MELRMRLNRMFVPALLLLSGCGGGEEVEEVTQAEIQARAKAKAKRKAAAEARAKAKAAEEAKVQPTAEAARMLSASGQVDESIAMLKELLAENAEEPATWEAIARIGIAHGRQASLLSEFDAETPIGGQTELHHRLRAHLALAAQETELLNASLEHLSDNEEVATFRARSAQATGEFSIDTEGLDAEANSGDALILAMTETRRSKKRQQIKALNPSHPAAKLLVAEMAHEAGERDKALSLYRELAEGEATSWTTYQAHQKLWGQAENTAEKAQHSAALARSAWASGDSANALGNLKQALSDARDNQDAHAAYALAKEFLDASTEATESIQQQVWASFSLAAIQNGQADEALAAATQWSATCSTTRTETQGEGEEAEQTEITETDTACLEAASWPQSIAAFQLGLGEELAQAYAGLESPPSSFEGLGELLKGNLSKAEDLLQSSSGPYAIDLLLAKARAQAGQDKNDQSSLKQAVSVADASGFVPDRILTRLHLANRQAEEEETKGLARTLTELDQIGAQLGPEKGAHLNAETHARRVFSGLPTRQSSDSLFAVLAGGTDAPAESDDASPLASWARARAAMRRGENSAALSAYTAAAAATPPLYRGPWTNLSVLNGRSGPGIEQDLAEILKKNGEDSGLLALPLHDWWHEREMMDIAFAVGDDPSASLPNEQRIALNQAHIEFQRRTVQWLAGAGESGVAETALNEAAAALDTALASAKEDKSYQRGIPGTPMDYSKVPSEVRSRAILSYRLGAKSGDALVVTKKTSRVIALEDVNRIRSNANALRKLLRNGEAHSGRNGLLPGRAAEQELAIKGDLLRADLLDIFADDLQGVGLYLLLLDADLQGFSFSVFPEQKDAARFIADIRSMSLAHTATAGLRPPTQTKLNYSTDILGLSPFRPPPDPTAGGLVVPGEAQNASRLFGQGVRIAKEAEEATAELLTKNLDDARFIHISDYKTGDNNSIVLGDGSVSLATIRSKDISTRVTILSADIETKKQMRQAHAFYNAGAINLVLSNRLIDEHVRGRFTYNFYEAINRERPPVMAISEARKTLSSDNAYNGYFDPSWWGQFILYGNP
jgi:hypothetical protein